MESILSKEQITIFDKIKCLQLSNFDNNSKTLNFEQCLNLIKSDTNPISKKIYLLAENYLE